MAKTLALKGGKRTVPEGMVQYWPWVKPEDKKVMYEVVDSGRYWCQMTPPYGKNQRALEKEWAAYTGAKYALSVSSGTSAIHCAVASLGIGPGDEVLVPAYTYIASATPVLFHNAIPIFVDVDLKTYNIDPARIEEKITEKTKAIIVVDLHGMPADYDAIRAIARKHNLKIIEDLAQAQGATYKGVRTGNLADVGGTSLNGGKNLSGGEGGIFTTNDEIAFDRAHRLHLCGEAARPGEAWRRMYPTLGWNYRFNEVMAAFVRSELARLDESNRGRQENAAFLNQQLKDIPVLELQHVPADRTHVYFLYSGCLNPEAIGLKVNPKQFRNAVVQALQAEGVPMMNGEGVSGPTPLPGHTLFSTQNAYGKGCPWSCPQARQGITYDPNEYPVAQRIVATKICFGHEHGGIAPPNGIALMETYAEAFRKVLVDNLNEIAEISKTTE